MRSNRRRLKQSLALLAVAGCSARLEKSQRTAAAQIGRLQPVSRPFDVGMMSFTSMNERMALNG
jgi:hypothetical protein